MPTERKGDWIQTVSGVMFYPLDPKPEEIVIEDIAHALAHQCRYAGHCLQFYSVAEHSVRVAEELPDELKLWGLLHDASEAYLVDVPRPLKRYADFGVPYRLAEDYLMQVICLRFGLSTHCPVEVHKMDTQLLVTEKRDLMSVEPKPWEDTEEPLLGRIVPWTSTRARKEFLELFYALTDAS